MKKVSSALSNFFSKKQKAETPAETKADDKTSTAASKTEDQEKKKFDAALNVLNNSNLGF